MCLTLVPEGVLRSDCRGRRWHRPSGGTTRWSAGTGTHRRPADRSCQQLYTVIKIIRRWSWGESVSHGFTIFLYSMFHVILSFCSHFRFFVFSVFFMASHAALGMPMNRKRKQMSQNETKKEIITWTAIPKFVKSVTIRLISGLNNMQHILYKYFSWNRCSDSSAIYSDLST